MGVTDGIIRPVVELHPYLSRPPQRLGSLQAPICTDVAGFPGDKPPPTRSCGLRMLRYDLRGS